MLVLVGVRILCFVLVAAATVAQILCIVAALTCTTFGIPRPLLCMFMVASLPFVAEEPNKPLIVGLISFCMASFSFAGGDFVEGRMETQPAGQCVICHRVLDRGQFATLLGLGLLDTVSSKVVVDLRFSCHSHDSIVGALSFIVA